ncbi:thioredoxin-like domain-containing protein [Marinifilum sp.]|uniref:thioredoxin-like domain-containing protein n=1 Tax=Marinifilum sp. TaxID=2033137 RepID=UPI003BAD98CA
MKKLLFILIAISSILVACNQNKQALSDGFVVKGKIKGIEDGQVLILSDYKNNLALDTCYAKKGKFFFSGKVEEPTKAIIRVFVTKDTKQLVDKHTVFYMENVEYKIETDYENFNYACFESNSNENNIYNHYLKSTANDRKLSDASSNLWRMDPKPSKEESDSIRKEAAEANKRIMEAQRNFAKQHANSYAALDLLFSYIQKNEQAKKYKSLGIISFSIPDEELKALYKKMSPEIQNTSTAKALYELLFNKPAAVGEKYIELEETFTMDGKPFKIAELKTDYVLIDFTGVNCGWCKVFNKAILPHYDDIKDKVEIVSFYTDTDKESIIKSTQKEGLKWIIVSDLKGNSSLNKQRYRITGIPDFFLLDKDRNIIKHHNGYSEEFVNYLVKLGKK